MTCSKIVEVPFNKLNAHTQNYKWGFPCHFYLFPSVHKYNYIFNIFSFFFFAMEAQSICGIIFKEFEDWNSQEMPLWGCKSSRKPLNWRGYVKVLNNFLLINSMNMSPLSDAPQFRQNMPQVFFFKLRPGK